VDTEDREIYDLIYLWRRTKPGLKTPIVWVILMLGAIAAALWYIGIVLSQQPHYALAAAKDANDNPMAWRLDTRTGDLETCSYGKDPFYSIMTGNKNRIGLAITCTNEISLPNTP